MKTKVLISCAVTVQLICVFVFAYAKNPFSHYNEAHILVSRGAVDESGEQFVAYFLPTEETLGKRKRDAEDSADYVPEDEYVHDL